MSTSITIIEQQSASMGSIEEQSVNQSDISDAESNTCCKKSSDDLTHERGSIKQSETPAYTYQNNETNSYASNKNTAEGLMDIALLSANANQLRFLITYNHDASTYYISVTLVALSLIMQILVGIALIFKRRFHKCRSKRYSELILGGVFIITVVNILLAAFTTTDPK